MTIEDQPPPVPNDRPAVWDLVIADMRERDHVGRARYGTPLQPNNGRDALVDAYQEALDLVVYLRQEIEERREIDRKMREALGVSRITGQPEEEGKSQHDYLSAGDNPYASGDRCYSGCSLCGRPRSEHRK